MIKITEDAAGQFKKWMKENQLHELTQDEEVAIKIFVEWINGDHEE